MNGRYPGPGLRILYKKRLRGPDKVDGVVVLGWCVPCTLAQGHEDCGQLANAAGTFVSVA